MEPLLNRKPDPQDVTAAHRGENDSRSGSSQAHCICVLLVSGMLVMIGSGITHSYGVILVELIDKEGVPPTQASWATGIQMVLFYSSGFLWLPLIEKFGWRWSSLLATLLATAGLMSTSFITVFYLAYITFGGMTGIGLGVLVSLANIVTQSYFEKRIYIGMAFTSVGFESGLLVFGPLVQALLDNIGLRYTLRALAGITMSGLFGTVFYAPLSNENHVENICKTSEDADVFAGSERASLLTGANHQERSRIGRLIDSLTDKLMSCCRLDVFMFGASFFCYTWASDAPCTFLPLHAHRCDIGSKQAATLLSVLGVSCILFRIIILLLPFDTMKPTVIGTGIALSVAGFSSTMVPYCTTYLTLVIYCICLGCTLAYVEGSYVYIVAVLMGGSNTEAATTGLYIFNGLADLVNCPISGYLLGATHDTNAVFLMSGGIGIMGSILYMAAIFMKRDEVSYLLSQEENILDTDTVK